MVKDYRSVMHACLRSGAWEQALALWFELRAQPDGPSPCSATYAVALRACGAMGRWTTARDLLAEMRVAGDDLAPGTRHYALTACAAAVADDQAFDEEAAFIGHGWGGGVQREGIGGGEEREEAEDGGEGGRETARRRSVRDVSKRDSALRFLLSEMAADGISLGWEVYAAVCWARSQRRQWRRASLGVLELMGEWGLRDSGNPIGGGGGSARSKAAAGMAGCRPQQRVEGIRGLYIRLLSAAGKTPGVPVGARDSGPGEGYAVRQVLANADERLASVGGAGPQVLVAAARAFERAGDWEGARDIAVGFASREGSSVADGGGGRGKISVRNSGFAAVAINAAVGACARAGEVGEAEALADLAREVAASTEDGVVEDGDSLLDVEGVGTPETARLGAGLDRKACLALTRAYERVGRFSDAEGVRLGLQRRLATGLGLEAADGAEGEGKRATGLPNIARRFGSVPPQLGAQGLRASTNDGEEEGEEVEADEAYLHAVGGTDEYDLFLEWMAVGDGDVGEEAEDEEEGGAWEEPRVGVAAGPLAGTTGAGWRGLTTRELEGW